LNPTLFGWANVPLCLPRFATESERGLVFVTGNPNDAHSEAGLRAHGAELVGELERYEDSYRLCYVRGPEGIIVALAEQLS
jgi:hypothetical protein